jgi:hypothetical protein
MGEHNRKRGSGPRCLLLQTSVIALIATIFILSNLSPLFMLAYADSINPGLFSKDSSPHDVPYSEWISRWWQWNMGIPKAETS